MEISLDEQLAQSEKSRKPTERSAAYPAISIEEAIKFVASIYKNFPGSQIVNREDVAAVLKTTAAAIQRDVAAAAHYSLLDKIKDGYRVAERFKTIQNFLTDKERKISLLEVFGSPKLYSELIEKHDGHVIPTELKTHLIRFHKIAEKAAPVVADLFVENAKFVGAANEQNILNYKQALLKLGNNNIEYAEIIEDRKSEEKNLDQVINIPDTSAQIENNKPAHYLPNIPSPERVKIPLTEKKVAYLEYPQNLKIKDIEILRKQIDLLELTVE